MKKLKRLTVAALALSMAIPVFAFAACDKNSADPQNNNVDSKIWAVYTAYAVEEGEDALSYEDWLADLIATAKGAKGDKGDKGDDGDTPEIKNGNWWIGGVDTGIKAEGDDGDTPVIKNGNWWIGGVDTGVKAEGKDGKSAYQLYCDSVDGDTPMEFDEWLASLKGDEGDPGQNGKDGNTWLVRDSVPTDADGKDGDLCLYTDGEDVWDVYYKVSGKWTRLGSIKGADGKGGAVEEENKSVVADVSPEAAATIDISDLSVGNHLIWAELDKSLTKNTANKALYNGGRMQVKVGDGATCELIKHAEKSGADKNVYYGFLIKKSDEDTTATLSTDKDTVKATITFEDYTSPTIKADGTPVIVPTVNKTMFDAGEGYINTFDFTGSGLNYDEGKNNVTVTIATELWITFTININITYPSQTQNQTYSPTLANKSFAFTQTMGEPSAICFYTNDEKAAANPNGCNNIVPLIVTMTVAD